MPKPVTALLLGGTGRIGGLVVAELLRRGASVRAIVRSAARIPAGMASRSGLTIFEADPLSMPDRRFAEILQGCEIAISCLGHTATLAGVFGPPRDLVTRAVARICSSVEESKPGMPLRLALLSSVSVNRPDKRDSRRGPGERAFLGAVRALLPPAADNQAAADYLVHQIGAANPSIRWAAVRPDSLVEGDAGRYGVSEGLVDSIFKPGRSTMANVASFIADLATEPNVWAKWEGRMPVITDSTSPGGLGTDEI